MASKRGRMDVGPSRFTSEEVKRRYDLIQTWDFTESRVLDQSKLNFPVEILFIYSPLMFILTLSHPYHSDMIREFYAAFRVDSDMTRIRSRVGFQDIEFSKEDIGNILQTSIVGPSPHRTSLESNWLEMNQVIRESNNHKHVPTVSGLTKEARVIQHVLRHMIIPKAGDRTNITPLLSATSYLIRSKIQFDVADLLIRYMENVASYANPSTKRKHNLGLGHLIGYMLISKYGLPLPSSLDRHPTFFSNNSFHVLFGAKSKGKVNVRDEEAEEEEEAVGEASPAQGEASAPPPPEGDDWGSRVGRLEYQMSENTLELRRNTSELKRMNRQQLDHYEEMKVKFQQDRDWMQEQFDYLRFRRDDDEE